MWLYTLLFALQIFSFISTVCGQLTVTAELHHPVTLPCDSKCPGSLRWSNKFQKVVSQCDQSSCRPEKGFNISHNQYLVGKPYLTITAADYSNRGKYTCRCEDSEVCNIRLLIQTLEMSRVITPGEPIDLHLPLTDLVEVSFTPSDAAQPQNQKICNVSNEKIDCSPDYKERASRLNTLQIKNGNFLDSGNYTVRDKVNDEIIVNLQINVKESKGEQQGDGGVSQSHSVRRRSVQSEEEPCLERSMPVWGSVLIAVLVILFILSVLVIVYQWREIQKLRRGPTHPTHQMNGNTNGHQQNGENERTSPNPDVENSVNIPLTDQQH